VLPHHRDGRSIPSARSSTAFTVAKTAAFAAIASETVTTTAAA
jgi:hypothetical protein